MPTDHMTNDLAGLLRSLKPRRTDGVFAFCCVDDDQAIPAATIGWFREAEGATVILPLTEANAAGLSVDFEAAWIALGVESSLSAVGLTAAVATALAAEGIACNVVAACRHDHLFVPIARAADAMRALDRLGAHRSPINP